MRRWRQVPVLLALLLALAPRGAEAQFGPILDWITKMSGPGVMRVGVQYTALIGRGDRAIEVSTAGMYGFKVRDGTGEDGDAALNTWSLQTTVGVPIALLTPDIALLGLAGVAAHSFNGDDFDTFGALSIPLQGAFRIRASQDVTFRVGAGVNFIKFPDDAFGDLDVGVDAGEWEASFGTQLSVIFRL